jgi:hypothetical protein
MHLRGF